MQTSDAASAAATMAEILAKQGADYKTGLTGAGVQQRLKKYGPNALVESQGWLVPALSWEIISLVWVYNMAWMIVQDLVKLAFYGILDPDRSWKRFFFQPLRSRPQEAQ
jgi:hypothetical protein